MKVIVKIEQYLPDTEQITFRICGLHSHKIINDYRDYAIEISDLDMTCLLYTSPSPRDNR